LVELLLLLLQFNVTAEPAIATKFATFVSASTELLSPKRDGADIHQSVY